MNTAKRILALALVLCMALCMAACGETELTPERTITYFSLSLGENYENIRSLTAYPNEDGTVHIEYVGEKKKVGDVKASALVDIIEAFEESGLAELNGQDVYAEGEANGSMYISFADENYIGAGFSGEIPDEYIAGYEIMDKCFAKLTKKLPVYVPAPVVMGEIEKDDLNAINKIIGKAELEYADSYMISPIAKDEYFGFMAGLSSDAGIERGVRFEATMMTTPFSLVMVTLEKGADYNAICEDFANNIDWGRWVCVNPDRALVAIKKNQVICMIAPNDLYDTFYFALEDCGWDIVGTYKNA